MITFLRIFFPSFFPSLFFHFLFPLLLLPCRSPSLHPLCGRRMMQPARQAVHQRSLPLRCSPVFLTPAVCLPLCSLMNTRTPSSRLRVQCGWGWSRCTKELTAWVTPSYPCDLFSSTQVFAGDKIMHNERSIDYCRTVMAIVGGICCSSFWFPVVAVVLLLTHGSLLCILD